MKEQGGLPRIDAHLKRLQERHLEWAQETAELLEQEVREAQTPLQSEIDQLHKRVNSLTSERDHLSQQLQQTEQIFEQRFQGISQEITKSVQQVLSQVSVDGIRPHIPPVRHIPPVLVPSTPPPQLNRLFQPIAVTKPAAEKRVRAPHRHFLRPLISVGILIVVGYIVGNQVPKHLALLRAASATGEVAGVSTERVAANASPTPQGEYPESFADVTIADTTWSPLTDPDFGVSIQYPSNATNLVRVIGGSNLWFLRRNGYLLKISRFDSDPTQTLDQWWEGHKDNYLDSYTASKHTFKSAAAWYIQPLQRSDTSGSSYFVKRTNAVMQVWIKDESPTTDDGQRLAKMLSSLQFTN